MAVMALTGCSDNDAADPATVTVTAPESPATSSSSAPTTTSAAAPTTNTPTPQVEQPAAPQQEAPQQEAPQQQAPQQQAPQQEVPQGGASPDCPAAECGYGTAPNGNRNPSSGELQTQYGCQQGYITDEELCAQVEEVIQNAQ